METIWPAKPKIFTIGPLQEIATGFRSKKKVFSITMAENCVQHSSPNFLFNLISTSGEKKCVCIYIYI